MSSNATMCAMDCNKPYIDALGLRSVGWTIFIETNRLGNNGKECSGHRRCRLYRQPCMQDPGTAGYAPVSFDSLVYGHEWAAKWGPLEVGDIGDAKRLPGGDRERINLLP